MNEGLADLLKYAESFLGKPYLYGGKTAKGYDCSGYVTEVLRSVGLVGYHEILSAQGLFNKFKKEGRTCQKTEAGALLFFGKPGTVIEHVAISTGPYSLIESGGGDSKIVSPTMAEAADARVRKRSLSYRTDFLEALMPKYPWD